MDSIFNRFWIYQRERFPIVKHGILILSFSSSGVMLSSMLRHNNHFPGLETLFTAFFISLTLFIQLRIADEHKDFEEDLMYRPYRPVQRGLVKLTELRNIGIVAGFLQMALTLIYDMRLVPILVIIWSYLFLTSKEFFIREWLKKHQMTYMLSHMLIIPFVDIFITACDWIHNGNMIIPNGLEWFIVISFLQGILLEIGRKIRQAENEENGVITYSKLWGVERSILILNIIMGVVLFLLYRIEAAINFYYIIPVNGIILVIMLVLSVMYLHRKAELKDKIFETITGTWTMSVYLMIGLIPFMVGRII